MTSPATPTMPTRTTRSPVGHVIEIVISLYGAIVFIVLWVGLAVSLTAGGGILSDVWTWLNGLEPIAAIVAWIAILPIAVAAWAVDADLGPLMTGLLLVGFVAWTLVAAVGLVRAFRRS